MDSDHVVVRKHNTSTFSENYNQQKKYIRTGYSDTASIDGVMILSFLTTQLRT